MSLEVEQKFHVADLPALAGQLQELGAHDEGQVTQVDEYYGHPARNFAQTDEALRLRRIGDDVYITYKGPKLSTQTKTRREIELPLGQGAEFAARFAEILTALSFRRVAEVCKRRHRYRLAWEAHDFEVALDEVATIGTFAELEVIAEPATLPAAEAALASLASRLQLSSIQRRSYLELVLQKQGAQ